MDKSNLHPVGPAGSILLGVVLCVLHYANAFPGLWAIGMLGFAFIFGGAVMLGVRIMNAKKTKLPR